MAYARSPHVGEGARVTDGDTAAPTKPTVAVIDDDPNWREFVRIVFEDEDVRIVNIDTAVGAAPKLREEGADLVLVDLRMAGVPGDVFISGAKRIRQLNKTQFVMCSNASYDELQRVSRWAGADGFLRKTAEPAELIKKVREFLAAGDV
jgi:DNA-binding response OmpR family regulator